jgi:cytochrome c oxidase subunit 1
MMNGVTSRPTPQNIAPPPLTYLSVRRTIWSWLLTGDHKRIALLYMVSITLFFFVAGAAAALMRLELLSPKGELVTSETYNKLFTIHGVVMVWFFLIPSIPTVLGNFLLPLMIGARDVAFPRLNLGSWYLFMVGGAFTLFSIITGGVDTGWTFYTPYSSTYANGHVIAMAAGIFIAGFGSIATGLNFIVTVHHARTWLDLVAVANFCLVALHYQHHFGAGDPGAGHYPNSDGPGACLRGRVFQSSSRR